MIYIFGAIIVFLIIPILPVIGYIIAGIIFVTGFIIYLLTKTSYYAYKVLEDYTKADNTKKLEIIAKVKLNFKNIRSLLGNIFDKTCSSFNQYLELLTLLFGEDKK